MDGASQTAIAVARFRAAHVMVDPDPIFTDELAKEFAGCSEADVHAFFAAEVTDSTAHVCRLFPCQRARFVEESVEHALQRGVEQFVNLGAGLDTFGWRRADLMSQLELFEVDHPATQEYKLERLAVLDLGVPTRLHMVDMDFIGEDTLADRLASAGFDPSRPSIWSWLGVLMYLPLDTIQSMLRAIADLAAPGSEIIASYRVRSELMDEASRELDAIGTAFAARVGEPQITWLSPSEIEPVAQAAGWRRARSVDAASFESWFAGRTDGLKPVSFEWMLVAEI